MFFKRCGRFSLLESFLGTLDGPVYFCQSRRESSVGKGSYHQPDGLNLVTGAHMAEERTNSYKLSLVLCMHTFDKHDKINTDVSLSLSLNTQATERPNTETEKAYLWPDYLETVISREMSVMAVIANYKFLFLASIFAS